MATKKQASKAHRKPYYLRTLRTKKGFSTLKQFAKEVANAMGKTSEKDLHAITSNLSRYETGKKPSEKYFDAIKEVLKLSVDELKSINKSFGRTGNNANKKSAKKKPARKPRVVKPVKNEPAQKSGMITPEAAAKFSSAVAALDGISIERAKQILEDLVTT